MNRTALIGISLLLVILAGIGLVAYIYSQPIQEPQQQGTTTQPPLTTNVSVITNATQDVRAAFEAIIAQRPDDNTKLYKTSVVGDYALQVYAGDILGGQALMTYDRAQKKWVIVDAGGGAWSIEGLIVAGVPENIAPLLIEGLYK